MLRFFKYNDPYRLLAVLVFTGLLSIPFFVWPAAITVQQLKDFLVGEAVADGKTMYVQTVDQTPILYAWVMGILNFVFGRSPVAFKIIALFIFFFQAAYFSIVLVRNKVFAENNYLSALVFVVIAFFSFDDIWVTPELLGSGFLLLAINNLFKEVEFKTQRDETILNLGLWVGLASLIIFSYSIFLIGSLIVLLLFTRLSLRRGLLLIFGFALPHLLLIISFYFWGNLNFLYDYFYKPNLGWSSISLVSLWSIFNLGLLILAYGMFALFMLNREARFTKYQSQILQVMFVWLLIASIEIVFVRERTPHSFIVLFPSIAYFITHYLLLIRRKWLGEITLWIFCLGSPAISTFAQGGRLRSVDYTKLFISESQYSKQFDGKRILALVDDKSVFLKNRSASYFLDWNLSKEVFDHPDYFESVIMVSDSFDKDQPDIIIDPHDKMGKFFDRLPKYKGQYKKEREIYFRISN